MAAPGQKRSVEFKNGPTVVAKTKQLLVPCQVSELPRRSQPVKLVISPERLFRIVPNAWMSSSSQLRLWTQTT